MKVAILCPGPSLKNTYGRAHAAHDVIIGVNRAVHAFRCDWWAFSDWYLWIESRPVYAPKLLFTRACESHLERKGHRDELAKLERVCTDHLATDCPREFSWTMYTKTAAMVFAHSLGATQLDMYGDDMNGVEDYDGHTSEHDNRRDTRWQQEREITDNVSRWMIERGVNITRMQLGTA